MQPPKQQYIIYINDLPTVSSIFEMLMNADNTTLYCNLDQNSTSDSMNNEFKLFIAPALISHPFTNMHQKRF